MIDKLIVPFWWVYGKWAEWRLFREIGRGDAKRGRRIFREALAQATVERVLAHMPRSRRFDDWPEWYCPFIDEDRPPEEIWPCAPRYRITCGCKTNGVPSPFRRYRRSHA